MAADGPVDSDAANELCERVREAAATGTPLCARGGRTKTFYGEPVDAADLDLSSHRGIVNYAPSELVLTARAGTPLARVEELLAEHLQHLPFEPPRFGDGATIGGTVACGLSGPCRPWSGATRDLVLGTRVINGEGELLRFGGEVIKNVAGYDISRLMTGSLGTLGVITEVSVKVLPMPEQSVTLVQEQDDNSALQAFLQWRRRALPLSGLAHFEHRSYIRLSGNSAAIEEAIAVIGGEQVEGTGIWHDLREQQLAFFASPGPLWRISVAPATPALFPESRTLIDWGGGLRWLRGEQDAAVIRAAAANAGGHATCLNANPDVPVFHPLEPALFALHKRVKHAMDPHGIFAPGRMYRSL